MAKRFTDTSKWGKAWFFELSLDARWMWIYLVDNCDNTGVWSANFSLMSFQIGFSVNEVSLKSALGNKIIKFDTDKFFIPSFIDFQYGELSDANRAHRPVIKFLENNKQRLKLIKNDQDKGPSIPLQEFLKGDTSSQRQDVGVRQDVEERVNQRENFDARKFLGSSQNDLVKSAQEKTIYEISANITGNVTVDGVIQLYNDTLAGAGKLKICKGLGSKSIKELLSTFSRLPTMDQWSDLFALVKANTALTGASKTVFLATLDWLAIEDNALKVLSGKYDLPTDAESKTKSIQDYVMSINLNEGA